MLLMVRFVQLIRESQYLTNNGLSAILSHFIYSITDKIEISEDIL